MARVKVWCNEMDCWFNRKGECHEREAFIFDGECISVRYDKPARSEKNRHSRDVEKVRRDRMAKRVAEKIMDDMLARMHQEMKGEKKA